MYVKINKFAHILQVALCFASWLLVPVQQASQINSVWLTDHPNLSQLKHPASSTNLNRHEPYPRQEARRGENDANKHQSTNIVLKSSDRFKQNKPPKIQKDGSRFSRPSPDSPAFVRQKEADFSSTSAGSSEQAGGSFHSQASSFRPTIAELDTNVQLENQLKRRSGNADDEPNEEQDEMLDRGTLIRRSSDQSSYNATRNINATNYNDGAPVSTIYNYEPHPSEQQSAMSAASLSPFENAFGLYANVGNESLNQHIHFDEEQHQQLTNWAQRTNSQDHKGAKRNNDQVNYNNNNNQSSAIGNEQQQQQPHSTQSDNRNLQNNLDSSIGQNASLDVSDQAPTTTRRPASSWNQDQQQHYNNKSSHLQNNYYLPWSNNDDSNGDEHQVEPNRMVQVKNSPRLFAPGGDYSGASSKSDQHLLRFSPADHSSWSLTPTQATHRYEQNTLAAPTLVPTPLVTTSTNKPPGPPPLIYFSADGDKWNERQDGGHSVKMIDGQVSLGSSKEPAKRRKASTMLLNEQLAAINLDSASDRGLAKFNESPLDGGGKRYDYQYGGPKGGDEELQYYPNGNWRERAFDRSSGGRDELAAVQLLKSREAQLRRLRKHALLMQLKRKHQLANLNHDFGLANRVRPAISYRDYPALASNSYENFNNRRWLLGSLGQKLALPPLRNAGAGSHFEASQEHPTILADQADDPKAHLEKYFYSSGRDPSEPNLNRLESQLRPAKGLSSLAKLRPLSVSHALVSQFRPPSLQNVVYPPLSLAYGQAPNLVQHPILRQSLRQAAIPRRQPSGGLYGHADRYLASGSYDQASYLEANNVDNNRQLIAVGQNNAGANGGPSFIPVVAVTVTKTSPAPKVPPDEQTSSGDSQTDSASSDLDEYIEKKTRQYNQQQQQQHQQLYRQQQPKNYQNTSQSSAQSARNKVSLQRIRPSATDHYLPSTSNRDQQLTTVKSAVFGYLPNQEVPLNPLLGGVLNQQQQAPVIADQFYQPANDPGLPLALQLQTNNLVQNDIVHPFGGPTLTRDVLDVHGGNQATTRNQQHVPIHGHASSPFIQFANPINTNSDQVAAGVGLPFGHGTHQQAGQQLIAFAASELNPLAHALMMTQGRGVSGGLPTLLSANPQWFYDPSAAAAGPHNFESGRNNDHVSSESSTTQPTIANLNANKPSKGKKRSGDFFASAGQLLLSALPLVLAPTLGLMLSSMGPVLPTVARHTNVPTFPQQQSTFQTSIPGSYLNSLASGAGSGSVQVDSGGPHMFTPSPPLYSAPTNPYQAHNVHENPKIPTVKPTRNPNQHPNRLPAMSSTNSSNNRFLNATGVSLDSLMNGPNKPAAIVITTSTTSSPRYHNANNSNESSSLSYHQDDPAGVTTTTQHTIAAVDNLSVLSNQTVVFIPSSSESHNSPGSSSNVSPGLNFNQGASQYYQVNNPALGVHELTTADAASIPSSSGDNSTQLISSNQTQNKPQFSLPNNDHHDHNNLSPSFDPANRIPEQQQQLDANQHQLKKHHHYELVGPMSSQPGSTIGYIDGVDFDTQYASLPIYSELNPSSRQENNQKTSSEGQSHQNSPPTVQGDNSLSPSMTSSSTNKNSTSENDTKLYPVRSWPSMRRRTTSLVTRQGNKTITDASDRYRDHANGAPSYAEFMVEPNQVTKRPNSRIFRRILSKRDLASSPVENLEDQETAKTIHRLKPALKSNDSSRSESAQDHESLGADELEEARQMRGEMFERKMKEFDRIGVSEPRFDVHQISSLDVGEQPKQQLAMGSRGQIVIPTGSSLPFSKQPSRAIQLENPKRSLKDSMDVEMSSHKESMTELVGELMLRNQDDIMAQNALDADVLEDTDGTGTSGIKLDGEVVRGGHLESPFKEQSYLHDHNFTDNNRRRSADFLRQVRYSSQLDGAPARNSAGSHRGEDFGLSNNRRHQNEIKRGEPLHSPASPSLEPYELNPNLDQRDKVFDLRPTTLTNNFSRSANHLKPLPEYEPSGSRNRRAQHQQAPENGASTLASYSSNDFRPSTLNNPGTSYAGHQGQHNDDYYNYQNQNSHQRQFASNYNANHNNTNQMGFRAGPGLSGRNYYPYSNPSSTARDTYASVPPNSHLFNNNSVNHHTYNNLHHHQQPPQYTGYNLSSRLALGSSQSEDYAPIHHQADHRQYSQAPIYNNIPSTRSRYDQPTNMYSSHQANPYQQHTNQQASDYYRVPVPPPEQSYDPMPGPPPPPHPSLINYNSMSSQPPINYNAAGSRSIGPYGLMDDRSSGAYGPGQPVSGHYAAGSMLAHQAGPLASLAANNSNDSGTVNEYLKQVHFSDSDRDKLMASYLTCDGLLNDNDHCLERLSCEFSDPQNIERANKLDRAVSSILKSASLFGYKHTGKCGRYVCNKLIKQQSVNPTQTSSSSSGDNSNVSGSID